MDTKNHIAAFIERWQGVTASELSTAQSFVIDLCTLLGVPAPHASDALATHFSGRGPWKKRLPQILQTLEALGRAREEGPLWRAA